MAHAGQLRHWIVIEQPGPESQDSTGQPLETWEVVASVWAQVVDLRGQELFSAQHFAGQRIVLVTIRYRAGVTPKMRIVFGTRILHILSAIDPRGHGHWLEIQTEEHV